MAVAIGTENGAYSVTWNGRLDNAPDVAGLVGLPSDSTAPILALAAYRQWGGDGLALLVGDWNLAVVCPQGALVLAVDYIGIHPLYYRINGQFAVFASSITELAKETQESDLQPNYIADFLCFGNSADHTPYRNVYSVPPGHTVEINEGRVTTTRFWTPPQSQDIRYRREADYADHLHDLFSRAVLARLPAESGVLLELSGGLDSSSVTAMAAMLQKRVASNSTLTTVSYNEPDSGDTPFMRLIEEQCNLPSLRFSIEDCPPMASGQMGVGMPELWHPRFSAIEECARSLRASVLLTGQLGDIIMSNFADDSEQAADRFCSFDVVNGFRSAFEWSYALGKPVYPILGAALEAACKSSRVGIYKDFLTNGRTAGLDSVNREIRRMAIERECDRSRAYPWCSRTPSLCKRVYALMEVIDSRRMRQPDGLHRTSIAHPFADRRLVEYMLRVPSEITCRPGVPRALMRTAFERFLPLALLRRRSKASYTQAYRRALAPLIEKVRPHLDKMYLVRAGFLNAASLAARLDRFALGLECNEVQLRYAILLEFWIASRWISL